MNKTFTCITCPVGCEVSVDYNELSKEIQSISGATCKRGEKYVADEIRDPRRVITSTVITEGNIKLLPVKTDKPIPKDKIFEAMKIIKGIKITSSVKTGDVIMRNFIEENINLVACRNVRF